MITKENVTGATTTFERAQADDYLFAAIIEAAKEARQFNQDVATETTLFLRLAKEGNHSAATEVAERATRAQVENIRKRAALTELVNRLLMVQE